ncbi:hypothetical protein BJF82_00375 [Kytococcus sp. CUA-901]|nr:hypothetical protein BJF82_00375 [Kytococcus sp. CUA-901]
MPSSSSCTTQSTSLTVRQGSVVGPGGTTPQRATIGGFPQAAALPAASSGTGWATRPATVSGKASATSWHTGSPANGAGEMAISPREQPASTAVSASAAAPQPTSGRRVEGVCRGATGRLEGIGTG